MRPSPSARDALLSVLKRELEEGTYSLRLDEVGRHLEAVLAAGIAGDEEMASLVLPLAAGLSLYRPAEHQARFARLFSDPALSREAKVKALHLIREHMAEPSRLSAGLGLYRLYLETQDTGLKDFAARVFLQNLTEMRVGGQGERLTQGENRRVAAELLRKLSAENWLEADELLDFLELADPGA